MKFQGLKTVLPWIGIILLLMIILYLIWEYYDHLIEAIGGMLENEVRTSFAFY